MNAVPEKSLIVVEDRAREAARLPIPTVSAVAILARVLHPFLRRGGRFGNGAVANCNATEERHG